MSSSSVFEDGIRWLTEEQIDIACKQFFEVEIDPAEMAELKFISPGDFKAISERILYEPESPKAERIIELFKEEVEYKKKTMESVRNASRNPIGFR